MQIIEIKYTIQFFIGPYAGKTEEIIINLEDMDEEGLVAYLQDMKYLGVFTRGETYFEVISREVIHNY